MIQAALGAGLGALVWEARTALVGWGRDTFE